MNGFDAAQRAYDSQQSPEYFESDEEIPEDFAELMKELHVERILEARESRERGDY